jgi:tRNA(Ile)-lysidine synthetase-like protein
MEVNLEPGVYVIAVSGGVDSVALLNMLSIKNNLKLIVAHYDHGIREDSENDKHFVDNLAKTYHLPFVFDIGVLGPDASEAIARQYRYQFLEKVRKATGARAILTAHHQDDLLETMFINVLRGTGRKGISPLQTNPYVTRPLLGMTKQMLLDYAKTQKLAWREDATNQDSKYLRNYLRNIILPKITPAQRAELVRLATEAHPRNQLIDELLTNQLHSQHSLDHLNRLWFCQLPHSVAREFIGHWLRLNLISFDARTIERLVVQLKTQAPGTTIMINSGWTFQLVKNDIRLQSPSPV